MSKILVTGALGQIGAELVPELRERHGTDNVIASGWRRRDVATVVDGGPFEIVDCTKPGDIAAVVEKYEIGTIYHMPAFLSVLGEERPGGRLGAQSRGATPMRWRWRAATAARCSSRAPSAPSGRAHRCRTRRRTRFSGRTRSMASPRSRASSWADYYHTRFGLDTRGPSGCLGLISHVARPGGRHHRLCRPYLLRGAQ